MTVGERIKLTRESKNLSQGDLAKIMDVSRQAISKAEKHDDNITTIKVRKFAEALNVSVEYLMGWDDTPLTFDFTPEEEEQELLALWRNASEHIKDSVMILLKSEL